MVGVGDRGSGAGVSAILLAAGKGERVGGIGKASLPSVKGRSLLEDDIDRLRNMTDEIIVGFDPAKTLPTALSNDPGIVFTKGGATRLETLGNALGAATGQIVLVWDVARPWVAMETVRELLVAAREYGAAMPVLRFVTRESLGVGKDGFLMGVFPRDGLFLSQTPQAYRSAILKDALEQARSRNSQDISVHSLVREAGYPVRLVEGTHDNVKLTFPDDLQRYLKWLRLES